MDVTEAIKARHSVRAYRREPLDRQLLMDIMATAAGTASWANTQPWEVYIAAGATLERLRQAFTERLDGGGERQPDLPIPRQWPAEHEARMAELRATRFESLGVEPGDEEAAREIAGQNRDFFGAPAVTYLGMDCSLTSWSIFDIGMMAQSIMLAATHHSVGSIPAFNLVAFPDIIRAELDLPDDLLLVIGIALGYEDGNDRHNRYRSPRRPAAEFVHIRE